ncbi:hypothetical protein GCM10010441_63140 [Kitasatospora paracochleata]|uniref:Uncharacterized protein n=1 Tax=Kitasatospora paracochleata TaxID=58354 RepID=A0ABT1J352_9ACTN|nr:hypothetical protein [Kitasatospora paracochleata]MCP2311860.1 hypothetical protein [Kitasatospora paracochleata]
MPIAMEFRSEATPDHGLIQVYDADAYLPDSGATARCRETVVASTGPQLYLRSLQGTAPVAIRVRVWDGPATTTAIEGDGPPDGWAAAVLESPTGCLVVRAFTPEYPGVITLPRPGVYAAAVSWRGRQAGAEQEGRLMAALDGARGTDIHAVFEAHREVVETYCIDLWWQYEAEAEDDDEW